MIGPVAGCAEIVGRAHQALAEVVLPEPVDDHPCQQAARAVVDIGQPLGHRRAPVGRAERRIAIVPCDARPGATTRALAR